MARPRRGPGAGFAPELLGAEGNVIDVVLRTYADGAAALGTVTIGRAKLLVERWERDFARITGLAQASTALALFGDRLFGTAGRVFRASRSVFLAEGSALLRIAI